MALRYFIRYLATLAWTFLLEFRNFFFFSSFVAFVSSFLQLYCITATSSWYTTLSRSESECCLAGSKRPWCYLGWIQDDIAGMAPTISEPCDRIKVKGDGGGGKSEPMVHKKQDTATRKRYSPLVVAFVGLPARGKTLAALKLAKYLSWNSHKTKVFNMSDYRRKLTSSYDSHDMFSTANKEAMAIRRKSLTDAMDDAQQWFQEEGGEVAILDGTHATRSKRQWVHDHFTVNLGYKLLFVECVCDQEDMLTRNVKSILKNSPDYSQMTFEQALDDFKQKVQHYVKEYQPMRSKQEPNLSFIKYMNEGEDISVHRVNGQIEGDILTFMSNYNAAPRTLYFSRHGESEYNVVGRIGGDTNLSPRGQMYGKTLAHHINEAKIPGLRVWTSDLRRTKQTAQAINANKEALVSLNELDAGVCEGLTYEEMADKFPQEFAWRDQDKLRYRYPWGESYKDIMDRVKPVLLELESQNNVLVVSHQAVLRCMIGYLLNKTHEELPYMEVPLHTIMKLTTDGYKFNMELIRLPVECVDTYRKQPTNCSTSRSIDDALLTLPAHFETHFDANKMWQMGSSSLLN